MNYEKLKQVRIKLGEIITMNMDSQGTRWYNLLCQCAGDLDVRLQKIEKELKKSYSNQAGTKEGLRHSTREFHLLPASN